MVSVDDLFYHTFNTDLLVEWPLISGAVAYFIKAELFGFFVACVKLQLDSVLRGVYYHLPASVCLISAGQSRFSLN